METLKRLLPLLLLLALPVTGQNLTGVSQLNSVLYVGSGTNWSGADIGAQINTAYAALPATGGVIYVNGKPDGTCYSYSTSISFQTSGKYVLLQGVGNGQVNSTNANGAVCLNYTPASGGAIDIDYVPASVGTYVPTHGIRNITLVNNNCLTSGGCGGAAFGIFINNVNWGASNATFDRVAIIGFEFGFDNSNTNNIPGITWINPFFESNLQPITNGNNTNNIFLGGFFTGNAGCVQGTATSGGEYQFIGTNFASNTAVCLDFTRTITTNAHVTCIDCHFEDSPAASGVSPHYIAGAVDTVITGGLMETDQSSGTQDWFVSCSGAALHVQGTELISAGKTLTQAFLLNSGCGADIAVTNVSATQIPTLVGGTNSAQAILTSLSGGSTTLFNVPGISSTGATFAASGCSNSTLVGGSTAGSYKSVTAGSCTVTITMGNALTSSHGWVCDAHDLTTPADSANITLGTTNGTTAQLVEGTVAANDIISFKCVGY